jgi:hypothetical protein
MYRDRETVANAARRTFEKMNLLGKPGPRWEPITNAAQTHNVKRNLHLIGQAAWSRFRRSETPYREPVREVFLFRR